MPTPSEGWTLYSTGPDFEEDLPRIVSLIGSALYEVLSNNHIHYIRRLTEEETPA